VLIAGIILVNRLNQEPGEYDSLAKCIKDSGAKFYGATWCSYCNTQKDLFGSSAKYLPYVECTSSNTQSISPICRKADIEGYPTWIFADGSREARLLSLEKLAEKTICEL
jgi:hypothetical protein